MTSGVIIKKLEALEDIKKMATLEKAVWGMEPIPYHQTFTAVKNGGLILGAFDHDVMVGFNYSFPGYEDGRIYLCSHMMGIRKEYRGKGIGKLLKDRQRFEAHELGYSLITWTFDPLESANGFLNLHKLRGLGWDYLENIYGNLNDVLNADLPTDRFQVHWYINKDFVEDGHQGIHDLSIDKNNLLITIKHLRNDLPVLNEQWSHPNEAHLDHYFVPIPRHYQLIKQQDFPLARDWRMKTRKVFRSLIESGFVAIDLLSDDNENDVMYYVFIKKKMLHL